MKELFLICALSVQPVSFNHEPPTESKFNEADQAFYRFLHACSQSYGKNDIVVMSAPFDYVDFKMAMEKLAPGGFLVIEIGEWLGFRLALQVAHYERLPFMWRSYDVYRKPFGRIKASA